VEKLFPRQFDKNLTPSERFSAEIRQKIRELNEEREGFYLGTESDQCSEKISAIADFIREHLEKVGKEQTVKDIQAGLTYLCKGNKNTIIEAKKPLEEDGDFGEITYSSLAYACEHYELDIILKYLRNGAASNVFFDTKNDRKINTDEKVFEVCECMKGEYDE
jgi:hypothetical protein